MVTKLSFSMQTFNALDMAAKRALYQEANETHHVDAVREMNELGMKPDHPPVSPPSIISNFMDIGTKYNVILGFLKELRGEKISYSPKQNSHRYRTKHGWQNRT